jgi:FdhD protein
MAASSKIAVPEPGITRLPIQKMVAGNLTESIDPVAIEHPLQIQIVHGPATNRREQILSITMRTPGNDEELAIGWLFTEGILPAQAIAQIPAIPYTATTITIPIPEDIQPNLSRTQRHSYTTSSCGVCGKTAIESLYIPTGKTQNSINIPATLLYTLPDLLRKNQDIFDATGGLHAAGLFTTAGQLLALREDIGRHNALDKLIGHALQQKLPLNNTILLLSGRACFELIQKAAIAGIQIVAAVGPPSSLAVEHARETGITLIGFLRQQRGNIYTGAHRIHL